MNVFCKIILPLLCIISCSERKEIEVYNMKIDENKKEVLVEIRNNTENNYYLLSPVVDAMADHGLNHITSEMIKHLQYIGGEMIEGEIHHKKLDSIVCSVCIWDDICKEEYYAMRDIVLLPKKSVKKIKYKYDNEEYMEIETVHIGFPYNGYYNEIGKKMQFMLKKKLDSSNIIKGYEFYNKDIETMTIKM